LPISYQFRSDGTLLIIARGVFTPEDLEPLRTAWRVDPRVAGVRSTLVDCRDVTSWELPAETVRHYALSREADPHLNRIDSRLAIVATSNAGYGLSRLYEQSGDALGEIEVFRTMEEAEAWLQRPK
jgi:hypothetical protein